MKNAVNILAIIFVLIFNNAISQGVIIDHTCENLSQIPMNWIDSVQELQKWHYAHTSHGSQLITGLDSIESNNPAYDVEIKSYLPNVPGSFCIFDAQWEFPGEYWKTTEGMNKTRNILNNNPTINVSQWSWCTQLNQYSEDDTQDYLDSISVLEAEFPNVTFVYMTGNAQTGPGNHYNQNLTQGYNRYLRNEQIRTHCINNNRVLFDFADIDCWWYNPTTEEWEFSAYQYWNGSDTVTVPFEHPQYNLNQAGHTSYENCENKGKASWWMMAKLAGMDMGIRVGLEVFIEGPFNGDDMSTGLNPENIPLSQPYNIAPWNYTGEESVVSIPNADVVDWVLVELRDTTNASLATVETIIDRQAAFLLNDGSVVSLDGSSILSFSHSVNHSLFVVIRHRNHLGIMSANPVTEYSGIYTYDFTTSVSQAYESNQKLVNGKAVMIGGDANADGDIDTDDKTIWVNQAADQGYIPGDFNMDKQVANPDKNEKWIPNEGETSKIPE